MSSFFSFFFFKHYFCKVIFFFFLLCCAAYGILVAQPGIKPVPPAVEAQSPNHWITREVLKLILLYFLKLILKHIKGLREKF